MKPGKKLRENVNKYIITGQQIGLLGGPLYTIYKILGAVKTAEKRGGNALFWMETNDADFNEINHLTFVNSGGIPETLKWDINSRGYSCGYIEIDKKLISLLSDYFDSLVHTEFTEELKSSIFSFYREGVTLGDASRNFFEWLFENFPVEIFDPSDETFRDFSKKILLDECYFTGEGQQCNTFILKGKKRVALFRRNGSFFLRSGEEVNPESHTLLPNVKTRSVCQDAWFKTCSYIAGPGEQKYLKEILPVFKRHNVKPAEVVPRMSVDIIEPRVKRNLAKIGITFDDVLGVNEEEMKKKIMEKQTGFNKDNLTSLSNDALDEFLGKLENIGHDVKEIKKELRSQVGGLIGKKRKEAKQRSEKILRKIDETYNLLIPLGKKQERIFNIVYYMNLYGGRKFLNFIYLNYDINRKILEIKNG